MTLSAAELGYEDATPSVASCNLGYEEAAPTPTASDLGYGEEATATPANANANLGYGEAAPTTAANPSRRLRRMGHRASIGGGWRASIGQSHPSARIPRRVTMDHHKPTLSSPSHHTLAPRRSSMAPSFSATQTPFDEQKTKRRVSFGGSDATNHVPKLHSTSQEKKEMWYDTRELNTMRRKIKAIIRQEAELDETEDCWRGLETFVKRHHSSLTQTSEQEDTTCNQIILQLQQQKAAFDCHGMDDESREDLQSSAQRLLHRATRTGNKQAAQDAAEALAIYMETMDSEQVRACFQSARGA